jgi:hypothetical protein
MLIFVSLREQLQQERAGIKVPIGEHRIQLTVPLAKPTKEEKEETESSSDESSEEAMDVDEDGAADEEHATAAPSSIEASHDAPASAAPVAPTPKLSEQEIRKRVLDEIEKRDEALYGPSAVALRKRPRATPGPKATSVFVKRLPEMQEQRLQLPILNEEHMVPSIQSPSPPIARFFFKCDQRE